jgi:hypothetical protein
MTIAYAFPVHKLLAQTVEANLFSLRAANQRPRKEPAGRLVDPLTLRICYEPPLKGLLHRLDGRFCGTIYLNCGSRTVC